ncbi:hypothetical protein NDI37_24445 [Funiculus sociatus GB2-A5]|uniref:Uncharacterized protein n=1 Tax=Funiculus sociatus GB2-A5 TaxID=2933946 RepID=A0ABV0JVY3_9CYAN|nr:MULTISPECIES: hypothetical protein [unclassified Trichocoleus]MBD1906488.1 hypothetical protein [Trichocoleus sp. FACHB-832]MBD2065589.1 hypothetical protein [Trichocoleus sp. FACHB-6]
MEDSKPFLQGVIEDKFGKLKAVVFTNKLWQECFTPASFEPKLGVRDTLTLLATTVA